MNIGGDMVILTDTDAAALLVLRAWTRETPTDDNPERLAELRKREAALSESALHAWRFWPAVKLAAELDRWRPAFLVQQTAAGYRAFRWIAHRRAYAQRACASRLSAAEAAVFRSELIRT